MRIAPCFVYFLHLIINPFLGSPEQGPCIISGNRFTYLKMDFMSSLAEIFRSHKISGTPVVENDKLIGIISIEDLIHWMSEGEHSSTVRDRMTPNVDSLYADEGLINAVNTIEETGFGRFPVLDRKTDKLVGVLTKGNIIEKLLRELEIDYHEKESDRLRKNTTSKEIVPSSMELTFRSTVDGDLSRAGEASIGLKKMLRKLGIAAPIVRRAAIASYEAEMNLVIFAKGGEISAKVEPDRLTIDIVDSGPGIPDVEKAMQPGYSTASAWVRELGFGAGMGLPNIAKCSDNMKMHSTVGEGTHVHLEIDIPQPEEAQE